MTSTSGTPSPRRRRRRTRSKTPAPASAVAVLEQARAPELDSLPEEPMSAAEVARMKTTLRFLREHRHTLKLKVNAAEDLLLNGRREPTHRGLCRHLLSKLDRARVLSASERLPPREATELLAGIVRFAPEIPYILRFLQCVKVSQNRGETAAALTRALQQLDFAQTSPAQLRDLLLLIVEVFPSEELPVFAFSLLNRDEFRAAVDRASEGWPESLSQLLLPLRALHAWLARAGRGRPARGGARLSLSEVLAGVRLMLASEPTSLLELPEKWLVPLFELGSRALEPLGAVTAHDRSGATLRGLYDQLGGKRPERALTLAAAYLRTGRDKLAREVLQAAAAATGPVQERARRWLNALDGERVGQVAIGKASRAAPPRGEPNAANQIGAQRSSATDSSAHSGRWRRGFHLPTQSDVLVRQGSSSEEISTQASLWARARLPGVAAVLDVQLGAEPFLVVASMGPPLPVRLKRGDLELERLRLWCLEIIGFLRGLAALGLALPDASLQRFNVDGGDRLWFGDLWGVASLEPGAAELAHARLAGAACVELLETLDYDFISSDARATLERGAPLLELMDVFAPAAVTAADGGRREVAVRAPPHN